MEVLWWAKPVLSILVCSDKSLDQVHLRGKTKEWSALLFLFPKLLVEEGAFLRQLLDALKTKARGVNASREKDDTKKKS